jgi:hypothetical protein
MKTYGGVEVKLHAFLISALDEGEWPLYHGVRAPVLIVYEGGLVVEKRKTSCTSLRPNPTSSVVQSLAYCIAWADPLLQDFVSLRNTFCNHRTKQREVKVIQICFVWPRSAHDSVGMTCSYTPQPWKHPSLSAAIRILARAGVSQVMCWNVRAVTGFR